MARLKTRLVLTSADKSQILEHNGVLN